MTDPRPAPLPYDERDVAVLDAKGLRALAHPVRVRLLGLLRRNGPATATLLATRLGLTSGATSYHLRQLAAAGFVEEDTERGNARERWWRSVHRLTSFGDRTLREREPEATLAFLQSVALAHAEATRRTLDELVTMPREWRETLGLGDRLLRLTPQEATRLRNELDEVVARYRPASATGPGEAPEGAEGVQVVLHVLPGLEGSFDPAGAGLDRNEEER
ncbi:helix-turn-helix domain-containing protein [Streptomyces carpaticus]|uniref:Helix-turn-helix domain-containing protein n=1 Tax=Streptomyces cheonanensis TaxID=312720 RepID=A0ABN2UPT5_9ACTN|nr:MULTISPECIES: helix-turn-helix domain-containing protein [Streptomyces]QKV68682.1 helix-turn-helix transcriptional regulator [Streptomyces harbinensis]UWM49012.1 helix-turn-helix domain-containing protein [Streptomyces carpaticus]